MQDVSTRIPIIGLAMNIVSRIDKRQQVFRGSSAGHMWYVSCFPGTQKNKLTRQRSRGTVYAGKHVILWDRFGAQ